MTPTIPVLELLEGVPYGAYAVNLAQTIRFWNRSAERITGHRAQDVIGRHCYEVVQNCPVDENEPWCRDGCPSLQAIRENLMPQAYEVTMLCASGHRKTVNIMPVVVPEPLVRETLLVHLFHEADGSNWAEQSNEKADPALTAPAVLQEGQGKLTTRELQVLQLTALGMEPKEIAGELHLSYHTVRNYTATIRRKLGARNKPNMVQIAHSLNLI